MPFPAHYSLSERRSLSGDTSVPLGGGMTVLSVVPQNVVGVRRNDKLGDCTATKYSTLKAANVKTHEGFIGGVKKLMSARLELDLTPSAGLPNGSQKIPACKRAEPDCPGSSFLLCPHYWGGWRVEPDYVKLPRVHSGGLALDECSWSGSAGSTPLSASKCSREDVLTPVNPHICGAI